MDNIHYILQSEEKLGNIEMLSLYVISCITYYVRCWSCYVPYILHGVTINGKCDANNFVEIYIQSSQEDFVSGERRNLLVTWSWVVEGGVKNENLGKCIVLK